MTEHIVHDYIAGALGGSAGLVVGYPFDTTKVQQQTQNRKGGLKSAVSDINKQGLVRGFFRGLSWPLLSYSFTSSVFFGVYGNTLKYLEKDKEKRKTAYLKISIAGSLGGAVQLIPVIPIDYVKVALQSQIARGEGAAKNTYFKGPWDFARHAIRTNGLLGMYKGGTAMAARDIPSFGLYCLSYEYLSGLLKKQNWTDSKGIVADLLGGGLSGVITWVSIMPIDVIKSRYQADFKNEFKNPIDCAVKSFRQEGIKVFFRGILVTCLRAFPVNAVIFMVYSQSKSFLENLS